MTSLRPLLFARLEAFRLHLLLLKPLNVLLKATMTIYAIDDAYGDQRPGSLGIPPAYGGAWDPPFGNCSVCTPAQTDPGHFGVNSTQLYKETWHTCTIRPGEDPATVSVSFYGTWIGVYSLLPPGLGFTTFMNVTFMLDNELAGRFQRPEGASPSWIYNASVFSSLKLAPGVHSLVVQPQGEVNTSYFLLDYFAYDFDDVTDTASASNSAAQALLPTGPAAASTLSSIGTTGMNTSPSLIPVGMGSISLSTAQDGAVTTLYISPQTTATDMRVATSIPENSFTTPPGGTGSFSSSPSNSTSLNSSVETRHNNHVLQAASIGGSLGGLCLIVLGFVVWYKNRMGFHRNSQQSPQRDTAWPVMSHGTDVSLSPFISQDIQTDIPSSKESRATGVLRDPAAFLHNMRSEEINRLLSNPSSTPSHSEGRLSEVHNLRREVEAMRLQFEQLRRISVFNTNMEDAPPSYITTEAPNISMVPDELESGDIVVSRR